MPRPLSSLLLLAAVASAPATAQTIWNVTAPNGIQAAIDAASPGDVIVLTDGAGTPDYELFTLNKGLTIRGNGASIGDPFFASPPPGIAVNIPPGETAHIEQIDTSFPTPAPIGLGGCPVTVHGGSVRFENCTLRAIGPLRALNATVVVCGGVVEGIHNATTRPAIEATNSHVTLRDCTVVGAGATCSYPTCTIFYPSQPAVAVFTSTLQVERAQLQGGSHTMTSWGGNGAPAVEAIASAVLLSDCLLIGGASNSVLGGAALVNNNPMAAELRNTALLGGLPGGATSVGPTNPNAPLVRLALAPRWARGAVSTLTVSGDASTLFAIAIAPDVQPATIPFVVEPIWLVGGAVVTAGLLDAAGDATLAVNVPNAPSLQHLTVWCQAVSGNALPLRASTLAGGVVH